MGTIGVRGRRAEPRRDEDAERVMPAAELGIEAHTGEETEMVGTEPWRSTLGASKWFSVPAYEFARWKRKRVGGLARL